MGKGIYTCSGLPEVLVGIALDSWKVVSNTVFVNSTVKRNLSMFNILC